MQWVPLTFGVTLVNRREKGACFFIYSFVLRAKRMDKNQKNYKNSFAISEKNMRKNKNTEAYSRYPKILRCIRNLFGKLVGRTINMLCLDI